MDSLIFVGMNNLFSNPCLLQVFFTCKLKLVGEELRQGQRASDAAGLDSSWAKAVTELGTTMDNARAICFSFIFLN
jgi:hypothetical protein